VKDEICPESAPKLLIAPISRSGAYGARTRKVARGVSRRQNQTAAARVQFAKTAEYQTRASSTAAITPSIDNKDVPPLKIAWDINTLSSVQRTRNPLGPAQVNEASYHRICLAPEEFYVEDIPAVTPRMKRVRSFLAFLKSHCLFIA